MGNNRRADLTLRRACAPIRCDARRRERGHGRSTRGRGLAGRRPDAGRGRHGPGRSLLRRPQARAAPDGPGAGSDPTFAEAIRQLTEYFAGERRDFDLELAPRGSAFDRKV
ncbi:hypothetical protein [Amycolatopsis carbonis]|uniref:hypothetical protein n=1 Tax=Amycolatopsis carbonis TaxID=715471 RepID=UPI003DA7954A